ncbi:MAG: DUF502 domain-containing protein, partial [Terriglobales bacterium]
MTSHSPGSPFKKRPRLLKLIGGGLREAAPLIVVLFLFNLVVGITNGWLKGPAQWILKHILPHQVFVGPLHGGNFPGASLGLFVIILVLIGLVASTSWGKKMFNFLDRLFTHIPIVSGIHNMVRKLTNTVAKEGSRAFKMWVLVDDDG